jgi:hypothetical protein
MSARAFLHLHCTPRSGTPSIPLSNRARSTFFTPIAFSFIRQSILHLHLNPASKKRRLYEMSRMPICRAGHRSSHHSPTPISNRVQQSQFNQRPHIYPPPNSLCPAIINVNHSINIFASARFSCAPIGAPGYAGAPWSNLFLH